MVNGQWIEADDASPRKPGTYVVILRDDPKGGRTVGLKHFNPDLNEWSSIEDDSDISDRILSFWLPDSRTVQLLSANTRARSVLDSVPTERPEISTDIPALADYLTAIRKAKAILEEGLRR